MCNYVKSKQGGISASIKNSNTHCTGCVNVNVGKRACDQCTIFSTVQ